jgi:hypothetical protein
MNQWDMLKCKALNPLEKGYFEFKSWGIWGRGQSGFVSSNPQRNG